MFVAVLQRRWWRRRRRRQKKKAKTEKFPKCFRWTLLNCRNNYISTERQFNVKHAHSIFIMCAVLCVDDDDDGKRKAFIVNASVCELLFFSPRLFRTCDSFTYYTFSAINRLIFSPLLIACMYECVCVWMWTLVRLNCVIRCNIVTRFLLFLIVLRQIGINSCGCSRKRAKNDRVRQKKVNGF